MSKLLESVVYDSIIVFIQPKLFSAQLGFLEAILYIAAINLYSEIIEAFESGLSAELTKI